MAKLAATFRTNPRHKVQTDARYQRQIRDINNHNVYLTEVEVYCFLTGMGIFFSIYILETFQF